MIQEIFTAAFAASDRRTKALTALQAAWPDFLARTAKTIGDLGYSSVLVTTEAKPFKECTSAQLEYFQSYFGFRVYADGDVCPCEAETDHLGETVYTSLGPVSDTPLRRGIVEAVTSTLDVLGKLADKADKQAHEAESILGALPPVQQ